MSVHKRADISILLVFYKFDTCMISEEKNKQKTPTQYQHRKLAKSSLNGHTYMGGS